MPTINEMNKAIEGVEQASEMVSGVKAGFTEKDGALYGPNGTLIARTDGKKAEKAAPKAKAGVRKPAAKPAAAVATPKAKVAKAGGKKTKADSKANGASRRTVGEKAKGKAPERRLAVVVALRKLGALSEKMARTADDVAAKSGLTRFDVYGQFYHTHRLQTEGYVKQCEVDGVRGLSYYLTAKGAKATDEQIKG